MTGDQQDTTPGDQQDITMSADADVRWRNPGAPTCEQPIRIQAVHLALNLAGRSFDHVQLWPVLVTDAALLG